MSKLDELLQGVDVEWIKLGNEQFIEIANNGRKPVKASLRSSGKIPYYGANNIQDYVEGFTHDGEYVLIAEDGSSSLENYSIQYTNGKFWANNHVHVLKGKNSIETKFLYYYLKIINFKPYLTGGERAKLTKGRMLEIQIPIPCPDNPEKSLEIQQEIVRVLDELTSLTNQLKTELETERQNRKKQIEFFREQLLSFKKGNVEWKTLGDIGNVKMCKRIFKNETKDFGDIPFYKIGTFGKTANAYISRELYEDYKEKYSYPNKGDILISAAGTIGRTVVFDGKPAYFQDSNIIWIENNQETIINEYLCHFYKVAKWYVSGGGTIDRLYNDNVRKTKIPVPFPNDKEKSLAEQKRIVKLLDQFDATHTAIEEEITKEIKLRTQQYEYYREKLLSFPQN